MVFIRIADWIYTWSISEGGIDMIKLIGSFLVGVLISMLIAYMYFTVFQHEKIYHCHAKKGFLLESLSQNSSVFVKVEPSVFCINLDNEGGKKK